MDTMETMETVEVYDDIKVASEVESCYTLIEVSSPKKRKSRSQEDTADKPKKPKSAYMLYYFDVHQIMQQDSANLPQSEINKRISESWKRLTVSEKGYYLEKAKLEKEGVEKPMLEPSQDLPGFRKILPRGNYVLVADGSPQANHRAACQSGEATVDAGSPSVHFPPLALGNEVELAEQCVAVEGPAKETATVPPTCLIPENPPSPARPPAVDHTEPRGSSGPDGLLLGDQRVAGGGYGAVAPEEQEMGRAEVQGDATPVMAIMPTQNMLDSKTLTSSVGPVMMVTVTACVEQSSKPSYKMDVKTYTRRGRGRCLAPGCSFVYVTRHKPPTCPECGSHLGGKWVPGKKTPVKDAGQSEQEAESSSNTSVLTVSADEDQTAVASLPNSTENGKERKGQRGSRKQRAVARKMSPEGSSTKTKSNKLNAPDKGRSVRRQDRNSAVVQKRPVRPILPACHTLIQFIPVQPEKGKAKSANNSKAVPAHRENTSGLKPSTLKQLGQAAPATTVTQNVPISTDGNQYITSLIDKGGNNILSVMPAKQNLMSGIELGLSTARGRGRCKNPSCKYEYKNRHKPAKCPSCGWDLSRKNTKGTKVKSGALLDPYGTLSPAQKDLQRQSTVQLLRQSLQIPESEGELQDTLALIQELNSPQVVLTQSGDQDHGDRLETEVLMQSGWPRFYESAATHCGLCQYPLFKGGQSTVAGQEDCWLLTETLIQTASLQLKVCPNTECLALHSFTELHPGIFNIGNRLLVTVDLFLKVRANIKLGHHPSHTVRTILDHVPNHPVHALSPDEASKIEELLLSGYWAFECLTVRDYNDMICGACGIAPKIEIAQRSTQCLLGLKNVEFTWPELPAPDEVHVDEFWLTMESEAIEQTAFPADIPITRVDASIIAPFIPPLMRSSTVINTEKDKVLTSTPPPSGDPSVLVRLIHEGQLRLDRVEQHSEEELRNILECCGEASSPDSTKDELLATLVSLYTHVQNSLSTAPQPPPHLTAGKLSKVCPHKVVCGSKYLVRGETARDHVDLLLSSHYWPPVYITDAARQVALCTDVHYPELASQMWGSNQGCFSDPLKKPELVSCAELQEQHYSADLSSVGEGSQVHPTTKSSSRWLARPSRCLPPLEHHSVGLCRELEAYSGLGEDEGAEAAGPEAEALVFHNAAYYYLYNRLTDFLSSRDIVSQQISEVLRACQPGEVVIRDALYRLGVAQIRADGEQGEEGQEGEGLCVNDGETVYQVIVP